MARVPISAETLNALGDGYAGKAVDKALMQINADLVERAHDGQTRKLTVTYTFKPQSSGRVKIDVSTSTKLPAYVPPETIAAYDQKAGGYVFSPEVAANPDQQTFDDVDDAKPRRGA